jgi:hypothetical protein
VLVMTDEKQEAFDDDIRLDGFFNWVCRGKWLIIFLVVGASGLAAMIGLRQPALNTATALIEVGKVWGKPLKDIYVTVEIANSPGFIQEIATKAGVKPGQLGRSVQVAAVESGVPHSIYPILIRITARTESADESVRLAQAVADEIIARHEKLFDDAIAPHLERRRQLEQRLKETGPSPSAREFTFKLESELDELKSNNSAPTSSEKTHLVEEIVPGATIRPDIWRGTATAGLIAAIVGVAVACLVGYYRPARQ